MTECEIAKHIDEGANFYLQFFGDAEHMELVDNGYYRVIRPKGNGKGVRFVFDIRLENLSVEEAQTKITEIKSFKFPIWWPLHISDFLYGLVRQKEKPVKSRSLSDGDELYMAITSQKLLPCVPRIDGATIQKVINAETFALWSQAVKDCFNDDYQYIHPQHHYPACETGKIHCYLCYKNDRPVSVCSILNNWGICSLEFVATHIDYRKQGLAKNICAVAIKEAFDNGAKLVTLRAGEPGTRELYTSLGFKTFNHVL